MQLEGVSAGTFHPYCLHKLLKYNALFRTVEIIVSTPHATSRFKRSCNCKRVWWQGCKESDHVEDSSGFP